MPRRAPQRRAASLGDVVDQALTVAIARLKADAPLAKATLLLPACAACGSSDRPLADRCNLGHQPECHPSHPLCGAGIEAEDLVLEIAKWLTPQDCWALAGCARRFHALTGLSGPLLPRCLISRQHSFEPLRPWLHAQRWHEPLLVWKQRALHRATRITISTRVLSWTDDGMRAVAVHTHEGVTESGASRIFFKLRRRTKMRKLVRAAVDQLAWRQVFPHTVFVARQRRILCAALDPGFGFEVEPLFQALHRNQTFPYELADLEELLIVADLRADHPPLDAESEWAAGSAFDAALAAVPDPPPD